jgi:16S rRNA (guanine527-N7)-methyltransferase
VRLPEASIVRRDLATQLRRAGEAGDDATLERLVSHLRILAKWNARYRLTSLLDWREILDRHVGESLLPLKWIGPDGSLVDIGSGNGFPALPILACRAKVSGVLLERSEKKSLFLEAAIREMGLANASVRCVDARKLVTPARRAAGAVRERSPGAIGGEPFTHVISRATLHPEEYLVLAASLVARAGRVHLFGGADAEDEAARLAPDLGLRPVASQAIPGRRDSSLIVLERVR